MKTIEGYSMPETVMIWILLGSIILTLLSGLMGCSGIGARAEVYRIDEQSQSSETHQVPLRCLFVDCGGKNDK